MNHTPAVYIVTGDKGFVRIESARVVSNFSEPIPQNHDYGMTAWLEQQSVLRAAIRQGGDGIPRNHPVYS